MTKKRLIYPASQYRDQDGTILRINFGMAYLIFNHLRRLVLSASFKIRAKPNKLGAILKHALSASRRELFRFANSYCIP
jgi:hypothetical protein